MSGAEQLATVYAQAFLDAAAAAAAKGASGGSTTESLLAELDGFIAEGLDRFPKLEAVLTSALISPEKKGGPVGPRFQGRLSPLLLSFLKVLAHHGRLDILRSVHWAAHKLFDKSRGRGARVGFVGRAAGRAAENPADRIDPQDDRRHAHARRCMSAPS